MEILEFEIDKGGKRRLYNIAMDLVHNGLSCGCPEWDDHIVKDKRFEKIVNDYVKTSAEIPKMTDGFNCFICQRIFCRTTNHRCPCHKPKYTKLELINWLSLHSVTGIIRYNPDHDTILEGIKLRFPLYEISHKFSFEKPAAYERWTLAGE